MLQSAEPVDSAEMTRKFGASYESLEGTLRHILAAQNMWHARWTGRQITGTPDKILAEMSDNRSTLADAFAKSHKALEVFANTLTDEDYERHLEYTDTRGNQLRNSIGQTITYLVNHGTYHRGEASLMLTALGHTPGDLDYVYSLPILREARPQGRLGLRCVIELHSRWLANPIRAVLHY